MVGINPRSWCHTFWCGPIWSSLLPNSTSWFDWVEFSFGFLFFTTRRVCHFRSCDRFEEFVFQFHGPLSFAHYYRHFVPPHPVNSYPIVDISLWTSLTREQLLMVGLYFNDVTVGSSAATILIYGGFCFVGGEQGSFSVCCYAEVQPTCLKQKSPCFQVFRHFLANHAIQHRAVCEHHRHGWILPYVLLGHPLL